MKEKRLIIVLILLILLLLIVLIVTVSSKKDKVEKEISQTQEMGGMEENEVEEFVEVQENGSKVNTSEELRKVKTIEGLEIRNISLVENNNVSQLVFNITNQNNKTLGGFQVDIIVKDKEGKKIATIGGYIDKVKPSETIQLYASATSDLANAYDIEIIKK